LLLPGKLDEREELAVLESKSIWFDSDFKKLKMKEGRNKQIDENKAGLTFQLSGTANVFAGSTALLQLTTN